MIVMPGRRSPRSSARVEHVRVDAVLHRAGGAVPLDLREELDAGRGHALEPHERRAADRVQQGAAAPSRCASHAIVMCVIPSSRRRPRRQPRRRVARACRTYPSRRETARRPPPSSSRADRGAGPPAASGTPAPRRDRAATTCTVGAGGRARPPRSGPPPAPPASARSPRTRTSLELRDQLRRRRRSCAPSGARAARAEQAVAVVVGACRPAAPCRSTCSAAACGARPSSRDTIDARRPRSGRRRRPRRPRARRGSRSRASRRARSSRIGRAMRTRSRFAIAAPARRIRPKPSRYFSVHGIALEQAALRERARSAARRWPCARRGAAPSSVTPSSPSSAISSSARIARVTDWRLVASARLAYRNTFRSVQR